MPPALLCGLAADAEAGGEVGPGVARPRLAGSVIAPAVARMYWGRMVNRYDSGRERSQVDRGFNAQPTRRPNVFALGIGHSGPPHPHSDRTGRCAVRWVCGVEVLCYFHTWPLHWTWDCPR